mmetsp:Transcript_15254/g.17291  ORF Transcript_15254/g.17291 Transcript_15254/m.17291 type:complete len:196 (-) Transcript_15254:238-825(-)
MSNWKLVMLGETAVGKSSLVLRFTRDRFLDFQESTIGAAFATQSVIVNGNTIKFEIWDTAGQERYHSLAPMYYRGAKAAVVVYDITSKTSFERAKAWVVELQQAGGTSMVVALAGNKTDLAMQREVTPDEAQQYATANSLLFMETSAKSNYNVTELFATVAKHLPSAEVSQESTSQNQVLLGQTNPDQAEDGCAC